MGHRRVTPGARASVILANKECRSGFLFSVFPPPSFVCNPPSATPPSPSPSVPVLLHFRRRVLPLGARTGCPGHCRRAQGRTTCWVPSNRAYKLSKPNFLRRQHVNHRVTFHTRAEPLHAARPDTSPRLPERTPDNETGITITVGPRPPVDTCMTRSCLAWVKKM